MTVSLYKILAIKKALESLNIMAIPNVEDGDIDSVVSMFIVGLAEDSEAFNTLLNTITGDAKDWANEYTSAIDALKSFFGLIPGELNILMNQLKSVSSTLQDVVTNMMNQDKMMEVVDSQEKEPK